jgi:hypothetical protein
MGLTGKYQFRKSLWGKIVLRVEEEVKPLWSKSGALKQRWRDATLMDLAAPEMRPLIDMRFKPHLWARTSLGLEAGSLLREQHETHAEVGAGVPVRSGEVRRIEH